MTNPLLLSAAWRVGDSAWLVAEHPLEDRLILIQRHVVHVDAHAIKTSGPGGPRTWRAGDLLPIGWPSAAEAISAYIIQHEVEIERAEIVIRRAQEEIRRARELKGAR